MTPEKFFQLAGRRVTVVTKAGETFIGVYRHFSKVDLRHRFKEETTGATREFVSDELESIEPVVAAFARPPADKLKQALELLAEIAALDNDPSPHSFELPGDIRERIKTLIG